jgi:beta-lactamase class A
MRSGRQLRLSVVGGPRYVLGEPMRRPLHTTILNVAAVTLLLVALVVAAGGGYYVGNGRTWRQTHAQPVATLQPIKQVKPATITPVMSADPWPTATADMNAAIAAAPGLPASATLIDLNTGREYDAGKYQQTFEAASTSKLVAIFAYIHQVELGKATLAQTLEGQSAQDIIQAMIVNSDNDAWDKLNRYLKFKGEQAYLNSIGVAGKMVSENIQFSTPAMAKMLQLLYQGKLMNASHRAMVYGYMQHTTMNTLIPAVLPADATVYHKYGQIEGVFHDAAIVAYQGYNFVLVVYTDGGQNGAQANLIHAVTTAAFNDIIKS